MADIIETAAPVTTTEQPLIDAKAELAQQMQIALNGGRVVSQPQQQVIQPTETATAQEVAPIEQVAIVDEPVPFTFETLKEKFAYEKPEDVIAEIEALRAYKNNPISIEEIEFENEASKKLFEAIKAGKQKEAYSILAEQESLDAYTNAEVNKSNADDIIKLGMKYKYKDLTPSEIDYKFKKQFALPKRPEQLDTETDAEYETALNEWKDKVADIEMDKVIEAKSYKPELESHKAKLILPDIEAEIDEDYVNWKQSQEQTSKIDAETVQAYKAFTPKSIETKLPFNDEANKVAFEFQYEPTGEDLAKSVEMVTDINKFYQRFIGQDGKPDRQGFLKAIHFAVNAESMLLEAMKQSKNATLKSRLPENTNSNGIVRQMAQGQQMSDLDLYMQAAGVKR